MQKPRKSRPQSCISHDTQSKFQRNRSKVVHSAKVAPVLWCRRRQAFIIVSDAARRQQMPPPGVASTVSGQLPSALWDIRLSSSFTWITLFSLGSCRSSLSGPDWLLTHREAERQLVVLAPSRLFVLTGARDRQDGSILQSFASRYEMISMKLKVKRVLLRHSRRTSPIKWLDVILQHLFLSTPPEQACELPQHPNLDTSCTLLFLCLFGHQIHEQYICIL